MYYLVQKIAHQFSEQLTREDTETYDLVFFNKMYHISETASQLSEDELVAFEKCARATNDDNTNDEIFENYNPSFASYKAYVMNMEALVNSLYTCLR